MPALANLIALGEGFTTEFKRSMPSDLGREICAFANATGGVVLIGVDDAGNRGRRGGPQPAEVPDPEHLSFCGPLP